MKPFFLIWAAFALFTKWALAADVSFSYDIKIDKVEVCGKQFSKITAPSNSSQLKTGKMPFELSKGRNSCQIVLPDGVYSTDSKLALPTARGSVSRTSVGSTTLSHPVLPDLPLLGDEASAVQPLPRNGKLSPLCSYVENYLQAYPYLNANYETSFLRLSIAGGKATITAKAITPQLPIKKLPSQFDRAATDSASRPATPTGFSHLIIYDPLYEPEANRLKAYRNLHHHSVSYAISVTDLPGYHSTDPMPSECSGARYAECYFDPNISTFEGVSKEAVPSLYGFQNDIVAGEPYARVSYIPGIIRAFIRQFKKTNPLKYVVFMGDPRLLPNFYSDYVDYYDPTGTHSYDIYAANAPRWYISPNAKLTQNSDFWYANPELTMTPLNQVNRTDRTYFLWPCINVNGTKTYRPDCFSNESVDQSFYNGDTSQLGWSVNYPLSSIYRDINSSTELFQKNLDDIISVGRIHSEEFLDLTAGPNYASRRKDPGVNNYISKLILWESKDIRLANGTYPITAHELWTWDTASQGARQMMMSLFNLTDVPYFFSGNGDQTIDAFNFLTSSPEKYAWYIHGHGGHGGVQGPSNGFAVPNLFKYDHGVATTTSQAQNVQLFSPGANGTFYAGFIHANSCDVASYRVSNAHQMFDAHQIGATTISMADHLLTGDRLGAGAALHMNYNVGWSNSEEGWNQPFDSALQASSALCEPFGRTIARIQKNATNDYQGVGYISSLLKYPIKNKVLMGDPMARQAPKNCALPVGPPIDMNNATR